MEGTDLADLVGLDHSKCRAFDRPFVAETADDATRQGGFTHSQIAFQKNHAVTFGHFGDTGAEADHGLFVGQKQGYT
ncbi:hypothetical protein D3C75_974750 [compost metagenome]